jgi:hypothetical protein
MFTLTPGAAALAVATNTFCQSKLAPKRGWAACAGHRCHAKEQIARVAIWTSININWSKAYGSAALGHHSRETLDSRARTSQPPRTAPAIWSALNIGLVMGFNDAVASPVPGRGGLGIMEVRWL